MFNEGGLNNREGLPLYLPPSPLGKQPLPRANWQRNDYDSFFARNPAPATSHGLHCSPPRFADCLGFN